MLYCVALQHDIRDIMPLQARRTWASNVNVEADSKEEACYKAETWWAKQRPQQADSVELRAYATWNKTRSDEPMWKFLPKAA